MNWIEKCPECGTEFTAPVHDYYYIARSHWKSEDVSFQSVSRVGNFCSLECLYKCLKRAIDESKKLKFT